MKSFRDALKTTPLLGLNVMYPAPGIIERVGPDWDWVWIDGQHGQLGYEDKLAAVRACNLIGKPAVVRVPSHEFGGIGLVLDMAADGVMVPVVDTPQQAKAVVNAAKFPPLGGRSYGGRRVIDRQGRTFSDTANDDTLLIAQIETPEAVENAEAIAAVPGVDALFLGPDDVLLRRGYKMTEPRNQKILGGDMQAVVDACRNQGKIPCMVGMGAEMLKLCLEMGFRLIVSGGDVAFLANGSKQTAADARAILQNQAAAAKPGAPASSGSPY